MERKASFGSQSISSQAPICSRLQIEFTIHVWQMRTLLAAIFHCNFSHRSLQYCIGQGVNSEEFCFPNQDFSLGGNCKIIVKNCEAENISSLLSDYSVLQLWALREAVQINFKCRVRSFICVLGLKTA